MGKSTEGKTMFWVLWRLFILFLQKSLLLGNIFHVTLNTWNIRGFGVWNKVSICFYLLDFNHLERECHRGFVLTSKENYTKKSKDIKWKLIYMTFPNHCFQPCLSNILASLLHFSPLSIIRTHSSSKLHSHPRWVSSLHPHAPSQEGLWLQNVGHGVSSSLLLIIFEWRGNGRPSNPCPFSRLYFFGAGVGGKRDGKKVPSSLDKIAHDCSLLLIKRESTYSLFVLRIPITYSRSEGKYHWISS